MEKTWQKSQSYWAAYKTYQMMISSYVNPKFSSRWLTLHSSYKHRDREKDLFLVQRMHLHAFVGGRGKCNVIVVMSVADMYWMPDITDGRVTGNESVKYYAQCK